MAGLNVLSVIPEPTAAAISYGIENTDDQVVLVYDLGGGTFDITVIEIKDKNITVISTGGDHQLGGKNWDESLARYFAQSFEDETGVSMDDLLNDMETWQELLNKAEDAKKALTSKENTKLRISHDGEKATVELSREKFDELTADLLARTISMTDELLERTKEKGYGVIDKLLLVGGSTYMPQVRSSLESKFSFDIESHDPNQSVAKGAAIFGWKKSLEEEIKIVIAETTGQDTENINIEDIDEEIVNTAVVKVATAQGVSLAGATSIIDTKIINVTAKSFGIQVLDANSDEKINNLIIADDQLPARITKEFPTAFDNQEGVELVCYENTERVSSNDGLLDLASSLEVGRAELAFERALPTGSPIEITFELSEDGLLSVYGTDKTTGREIQAQFQTESVLSQAEVEEIKETRKAITVS